MNTIEKAAKAIYSNKLFAANFAPLEPEIFSTPKKIQVFETSERYSEFECEQLLKKYDWFRNLQKFKIKKVKVDRTQPPGYEISLNGNPVGFLEQREGKFRLGFCIIDGDSFKWEYFRLPFESFDYAKIYIDTYYGKIQDRLKFYIEPEETIIKEVEPTQNEDDDY